MVAFEYAKGALRFAAAVQEDLSKPALTAEDKDHKRWTLSVRILGV